MLASRCSISAPFLLHFCSQTHQILVGCKPGPPHPVHPVAPGRPDLQPFAWMRSCLQFRASPPSRGV